MPEMGIDEGRGSTSGIRKERPVNEHPKKGDGRQALSLKEETDC